MTRHAPSRALSALLLLLICLAPRAASAQVCATPGKDGPATLSGVVNTYFPGSSTASAGSTTVSVGGARADGASTGITEGDLLLVIQMQDADINSENGSRYGDGVNGGDARGSTNVATSSAGRYEYVVAMNNVTTAGGSVQIRGTNGGGLVNTYTNANAGTQGQRRFQVVRVPQYSSATLSSTLTAAPWDGATGGILAFDVAGALNLNSAVVSVAGRGFRGGGGRMMSGGTGQAATDRVVMSTTNTHGSKGEGIAGTPRYTYNSVTGAVEDNVFEGLPNGSHARGAPANAGGGGTDSAPNLNEENSGGGGGANGGAGGLGGNTWRTTSATGGYGGVQFPAAANRLVMGGGGGAGTRNNSPLLPVASSGGSGGGLVMVRAGTVSGSGDILADGADAYQATLNDGGGGGGAGGSVVVVAAGGGLGGLRVFARGGRGGDAWRNQPTGSTPPGERHGPGGGGGGGVVLTSGAAAVTVTGGATGLTTQAADSYGATGGAAGTSSTTTAASIPGASMGAQCLPTLSATKTTSTPTLNNTSSGVAATYTIVVSNVANRGAAVRVSVSDTLPAGFTYASTGSISYTGTATRTSTTDPAAGDAVPVWRAFRIPGGSSVRITFTVNIAAGVSGTFQNPATGFYADPVRTVDTTDASVSYNSASSTGEDVTVVAPPLIRLVKSCVSPANCETTPTGHRPGTELTYSITFTNEGGRSAQNVYIVDVIPYSVDMTNSVNVRTTELRLGSTVFTPNTSTLTLPAANIRHFTDAVPFGAVAPWTPSANYSPSGAAGTFDPAVTFIGWQLSGSMPPNTSGTVTFTVRIR